MKDSAHDDYNKLINLLLLDFQWIEEYLRINIGASYSLIARSVKPPVAFKPRFSSLTRDALGRLIEKFDAVTLRVELCEELRALVSVRNHCAHKALVISIDEQQGGFYEAEVARLTPIRERTRACVLALHEVLLELSSARNESPVQTVESGAAGSDT